MYMSAIFMTVQFLQNILLILKNGIVFQIPVAKIFWKESMYKLKIWFRDDFSKVILVALSPGKALLLKLHSCSDLAVSRQNV